MQDPDRPVDQIDQIHSIMERSATFVSLSGLSGIAAGLVGLVAARFLCRVLDTVWLTPEVCGALRTTPELVWSVVTVFMTSLVVALVLAFFFTWRKAQRQKQALWSLASRQFGIHLALPLLAGGVFVLALWQHGTFELICPSMLLFFGLAVVNAGKYSFSETFMFGVIELLLGVVAAFWVEAGLLLWGVGFGIVTAGYGVIMHLKYER
ncbi:MAG: hypothetical protein WAU88_04405 [Candidatus Zixiibacteriota bacterium]